MDPLSLLRQYNINKKVIIERDNQIIFDELSWPKNAKTNYIVKRPAKDALRVKEYYTLECLLYFLKNKQLAHPEYVRQAAAENIPAVRRPDRKDLLAFLNGDTATCSSIDTSAPLVMPTEVKDSKDKEAMERDQEALNNYQETRKRPWSGSSSPVSDVLDGSRIKKEKKDDDSPWNPTESVWQNDPSGMYGLKQDYLRILGIEPPICNWVCVENFRCDKSELREVLELAGYVVVCSLIYSHQKHAKVMYSHPLEAVQAVSMLNKQMFYGRALSVTMMKFPLDSIILPKALPNIGPGFGTYGKPLRDIVKHYERFVRKEPNSLNDLLFYDPNDLRDEKDFRASGSVETTGSDIYERFQFSTQFRIRHLEDDSEDSRSENDSKQNVTRSTDSEQNDSPKTTTLPKYSPRSPTRSPTMTEVDRKTVFKSDGSPKAVQNRFNSNNSGSASIHTSNQSSNTMIPNKPTMGLSGGSMGSIGPVSAHNNSLLPNPMAMAVPNVAPGPVDPRFRPKHLVNPIAGPSFRPSGPMMGPSGPITGPSGPTTGPIGPMTGPSGPMTGPSGPMTGPSGPLIGPNGPITGPNGPGIRPNVPMSNMPGSAGSGLRPKASLPSLLSTAPTSFAVQFRNLPLTTTFAILSDKMSQCGQVMSIQLTTPGCATVSFSHPTHAQRCFQRFNNLCVDGCVIQARLM